MVPGAINYVVFAPVSTCDFDPDLIILFADIPQADIVMRATSFISGDFWNRNQLRLSAVAGCTLIP